MAYQEIIDALAQTWSTIETTLRSRSSDDYDAPTPCPGWSIRDVLSHLVGIELLTRGEAVPPQRGPWPDYVRNPLGEVNEAFVTKYRDYRGVEVLALFRETMDQSLEHLRSLDESAWNKVGWSPEGDRPFHRFQETRIVDSWVHLHDIRDALGEGQDDHGPGEAIVLGRFVEALPFVLGKKVAPDEGTRVRINLSGDRGMSVFLGFDGGRARVLEESPSTPDMELLTSTALFWRRVAGRVSAETLMGAPVTTIRGNQSLARAFVEGLPVMM